MDYVVNINGVDIVIEQNEANENRSRLLKYYEKLLQGKGVEVSNEKQKALEAIVENMTEVAAKEKLTSFDSRRMNRLMAYASALSHLTKEEKEMADSLDEVLEAAVEDEDQETILVNGNKFLFEKGSIDVNQYMQILYSIGEEKKGNTWTIYIDEEGELVIY